MSEHCPGCSGVNEPGIKFRPRKGYQCPGLVCAACAAKDAEIARLRALVAVGREMVTTALDDNCPIITAYDTIRKLCPQWRSLEGER